MTKEKHAPAMDALFDGSDAHLLNERAEFEQRVQSKYPAADFTRSEIDGKYIVDSIEWEWHGCQYRAEHDAKHIAELEALLAETRANEMTAMRWIADARSASGFNADGKMPEFIEYLRWMKEQLAASNQKLAEQQAREAQLGDAAAWAIPPKEFFVEGDSDPVRMGKQAWNACCDEMLSNLQRIPPVSKYLAQVKREAVEQFIDHLRMLPVIGLSERQFGELKRAIPEKKEV